MQPSGRGDDAGADEVDIVEKRGITTVFDGVFPVVTVSRRGRPRALKRRQPKWSRVSRVHYIVGGSLERVHVYEGLGTDSLKAVVRQVGDKQRESQCDDCIRLHRPSNKRCSASLGIDSAATDSGVLYDFATKKPAGRWRRAAMNITGRERVGTCEFFRQ